jgi:hypothetical protein
MREIKFRVKTLDGGVIYFDLHESHISGDAEVFYVGGTPCFVGSEQVYALCHDKNGKEMYEGDILRADGRTGIIEWSEGDYLGLRVMWVWDKKSLLGVKYFYKPVNYDNLVSEVIGNIYENPELLK